MRSHRSFFCLLLCVCILFGLFSVSAFAIDDDNSYFNGEQVALNIVDENGFSLLANDVSYTVKQYWKPSSSSNWNNYTNSIITDTQYSTINILFEIILASEIEKNSNFDVTLNINSDSYGSITSKNFMIYDSAGNPSCSDLPTVNINGSRVDVINIWNDLRSSYKIEFSFTIENPSYTLDEGSGGGGEEPEATEAPTEAPTEPPEEPDQPQIGVFYLNSTILKESSFNFEIGMTWRQWVNSDYNPYKYNYSQKISGFSVNTQNFLTYWKYKSGYSFESFHVYADNSYSYLIGGLDYITENAIYYLLGEAPKFAINSSGEQYKYDFMISSVSVSILDQEEVSGGILGWIKSIFNGIKNLPANIASKISGFFTELGNKISALGDAIINGIKSLFIPSEDSIEEMKSKFEGLLEERFGAVYESTAVIDNFANAFFNTAQVQAVTDTGGTIYFPLVTVPLAGSDFSFGGWDVDIIPDKFQGIVDMLKMAIDIVCTFVFVNALRKKLEGILR